MKFVEPKYSRSQINKAGESFRGAGSLALEDLDIFDNWRAAHSYPMQIFYNRLKKTSKSVDSSALVAQRLKRTSSIIAKLGRSYGGHKPTMELYQMQDIAGCRAILKNVDLAKKLAEEHYVKGDLKHKLVNKKDYIAKPKSDGYRSIHLIYRYRSDKAKTAYNGLLVEVQIRSKLQHLWATAVEAVGFFTRQAIKSNEGSPEWTEFFKLVSSAFAKMESCPLVPDLPTDERELYAQILQKERELNVINKIEQWAAAIQTFEEREMTKGATFFLLELNIKDEKLTIRRFTKKEEQMALDEYAALEKKYAGNKEYDVVLTGVDKANDLRKAYPNYYVDMGEFAQNLKSIIQKAQR
ncbi:hypothetical protein [Candidatus Nitrososphaera sp. FF02]|uniref:hypothetical protein n=1 Tax=Candidatus Nitrososphaera sp. FF02 TaxID=3398226 RepID=UPI0039ED6A66